MSVLNKQLICVIQVSGKCETCTRLSVCSVMDALAGAAVADAPVLSTGEDADLLVSTGNSQVLPSLVFAAGFLFTTPALQYDSGAEVSDNCWAMIQCTRNLPR